MTPRYLIAILLATIPTLTDETPLLSRAQWNEDGSVTWQILAVDGQRLVRIEVSGSLPDDSTRDRPIQATAQRATIAPIKGSVTKVDLTVKGTSGWREQDIRWQTTWTIHFADGETLTVPDEQESQLHDDRERIDHFVQGFIAAALPR